MKEFACGDVVPGCTATFSAEDEDGLMAQVATHARDAHGIDDPPPELLEGVRAKMRDAA